MRYIQNIADHFGSVRFIDYLTPLPIIVLTLSFYLHYIRLSGTHHTYNAHEQLVTGEHHIFYIIVLFLANNYIIPLLLFYPHARKWLITSSWYQRNFESESLLKAGKKAFKKQRNVRTVTRSQLEYINVNGSSENESVSLLGRVSRKRDKVSYERSALKMYFFLLEVFLFRPIIFILTFLISPLLFIVSVFYSRKRAYI